MERIGSQQVETILEDRESAGGDNIRGQGVSWWR